MQPKSQTGPGAVRERRGFTTIELMVVVAILGILAALAAPSFTLLIERWRVTQAAEDLRSSLMLARIEALRRGGGVVFARSAITCPGAVSSNLGRQWDCGWTTFVDSDGNNALDEGETVIAIAPPPRGIEVSRTGTSANPFLRMDRWGEAGISATGIGFIVKPLRAGTTATAAICISTGGRIAIRQGDSEC